MQTVALRPSMHLCLVGLVLTCGACFAAPGYWTQVKTSTEKNETLAKLVPEYKITYGGGDGSAHIGFVNSTDPKNPSFRADTFTWSPPPASLTPGTTVSMALAIQNHRNNGWYGAELYARVTRAGCACGITFAGDITPGRISGGPNDEAGKTHAPGPFDFVVPDFPYQNSEETKMLRIQVCCSVYQAWSSTYYDYEWREGTPPARGQEPAGKPQAPVSTVPCKEALAFYSADELKGYYSDKAPSLNFTREQFSQELMSALDRYLRNHPEKPAFSGASSYDAPWLAAKFASSAEWSGKEPALHAAVRAKFDSSNRATPGQLFELALEATEGNVRNALVLCHAAVHRGAQNAAFVNSVLAPIRNKEGYADSEKTYRTALGIERRINPRRDMAMDEVGPWYHFFGMAAIEFTDESNIVPFETVRYAAEDFHVPVDFLKAGPFVPATSDQKGLAKPEYRAKVQELGFQRTKVGGILADYAISLEDGFRTSPASSRPPDPDKQCVNYAGVAAGRALREHLQRIAAAGGKQTEKEKTGARVDMPAEQPVRSGFNPDRNEGSLRIDSPLSIAIDGDAGERFAFDQEAKQFTGNTPFVAIEVLPEKDGTWGLTVSPFFKVMKIELTATGSGAACVSVYDKKTRTSRVHHTSVSPGDVIALAGFGAVPALNGRALAVMAPEDERPGVSVPDVLHVDEVGEWKGVWRRRAGSDLYDAEWRHDRQTGYVRDVIRLESSDGGKVVFSRKSMNGRYTGTVSADGKTVEGTASWYEPGQKWRAMIGSTGLSGSGAGSAPAETTPPATRGARPR